jgi:hypothetical protein
LFPFETFVTIFWIIELTGRFYGAPVKLNFFKSLMTWVDVISLLPYFIHLIPDTPRGVKIMSIFRLLRVLKLVKMSAGAMVVGKAMWVSMEALWLLLLSIVFLLVITSTGMYWAERGTWSDENHQWERPDGSRSPFSSIPEGFYWSMTTLATVGYGDTYPITPLGKFFANLTMLFSILTMALPTAILGSNFLNEWQAMEQERERKKQEKKDSLGRGGSKTPESKRNSSAPPPKKDALQPPQAHHDVFKDIAEWFSEIKKTGQMGHIVKPAEAESVNYKTKCATLEEENARIMRELEELKAKIKG